MKDQYFADVHVHLMLWAYNQSYPAMENNLWEAYNNESLSKKRLLSGFINTLSKGMQKRSQSNLYQLADGKVRVAYASMYPLEKGLFEYKKAVKYVAGNETINAAYKYIFGVSAKRIIDFQQQKAAYYRKLKERYQFITQFQGPSPCGKYKYKVCRNYAEVDQIIKNEPDTLAIILTIEGGHALGCGNLHSAFMNDDDLSKRLTTNIGQIKEWEYPVLFVGLAHLFWNQLCGHARSFKPPVSYILNQRFGLDTGIQTPGWTVINELLSTDNGKKILIDTKHMSIQSRIEYYAMLQRYDKEQGTKTPIIISHGAVTGTPSMNGSILYPDTQSKNRKSQFNQWSYNISDEEIKLIHASEGMIGIILDRSVLGGGKLITDLKRCTTLEERKRVYLEQIWLNIFHIIAVCEAKTAWNIINIGSDFDGMIQSLEYYNEASKFIDLYTDLLAHVKETNMYRDLWYDYSPEEMLDKIMRKNAMDFLEKHFV